jgi:diguanylate cyclase (GGDEF)-like protein
MILEDLEKVMPEFEHLRAAHANNPEMLSRINKIEKEMYTDTRTGIPNLAAHEDHEASIANKPGVRIHADLNDFKQINDKISHEAGDRALITFAQTTHAIAQKHGGKAFRTGGDEFTYHFEHPEHAHAFVRETKNTLDQMNAKKQIGREGDPRKFNLAGSFGIGTNKETAETALQVAKRSIGAGEGRGRVNYHPEGQAPTVYHSSITNAGHLSPFKPPKETLWGKAKKFAIAKLS